jgi:hypothetical protein
MHASLRKVSKANLNKKTAHKSALKQARVSKPKRKAEAANGKKPAQFPACPTFKQKSNFDFTF